MREIVDVQIGEVRSSGGKVILQSKAIGSCIAIVAYDAGKNIGAMAHVMLPGTAPADKDASEKTKYVTNAVDAMVEQMAQLGSKSDDAEVVLVGGGNILNRKNDTICKDNIKSSLRVLRKKHLRVKAMAVGGTSRRSVSLDVERGIVSYTEGDSTKTHLWRAQKPQIESLL